jgi:hypothetical protein
MSTCTLRELARLETHASACCTSGALSAHPACWTAQERSESIVPVGQACKQLGGKVEWCVQCARELLGQRELAAWLRHANNSLAAPRKSLARRTLQLEHSPDTSACLR